jgi:hypothetical protein
LFRAVGSRRQGKDQWIFRESKFRSSEWRWRCLRSGWGNGKRGCRAGCVGHPRLIKWNARQIAVSEEQSKKYNDDSEWNNSTVHVWSVEIIIPA